MAILFPNECAWTPEGEEKGSYPCGTAIESFGTIKVNVLDDSGTRFCLNLPEWDLCWNKVQGEQSAGKHPRNTYP